MSIPAAARNNDTVNARKYDVADTISLLDVGRYPLLAILTNAGKDPVTKKGKSIRKEVTHDSEFKWFEDEFGSRTATTHTGQTGKDISAQFTVVVASGQGARFAAGDVVKFVLSGNTHTVVSVSSDTLTLSAELGGVTGTLDLSSLELWIIGNANEEGAGLRAIKLTQAVEKTGYTQIFRTPFGITRTAKNTKTFIRENDLAYMRRKKGIEHMVDIETNFIFGKKHKSTAGSHPKRFTEGALNVISTYATANVDTEAEFEAFLEDAFRHGNTEKYALCGAAFVSQINLWAKNKLQIMQGEKTYGLTILRYVSPHGTLNIIKHDLLKGSKYGNYCVVLDMEALTYRYLADSDTSLLPNRQTNDADGVTEEYLTECGLQMEQEKRHAIASKAAL